MSLSRLISAVVLGLLLTACGFQLRTAPEIPAEMSRTYISADDQYSLFYRKLRHELKSAGAQVVESSVESSAVFRILD
ncbi:MAG: hypothetical protein ACE5KS_00585, partial [Woeseiaceae bacterium]